MEYTQESACTTSAEFHASGPDATRWVAHNVVTFSGVMKVIALLIGKSFPEQSYPTMEAFKAFAEAQSD